MQKFTPSLDKGPLPLRQIRDANRRLLLDLLDSVRGRKALVLEPGFASPLSLVAEARLLKEHGVEMFCVLEDLQPGLARTLADRGVRHVVYLVRSELGALRSATAHAAMLASSGQRFDFTLLLIPRATKLAASLVEGAGLAADAALRACPLDWVPLDEDLLSLELGGAFKELAADGDRSCLHAVARALTALQATHGAIGRVLAKGDASAAVARLLGSMRAELGADAPAVGGDIDALVMLDRSVDVVSPMCTQLTYEGLLDEVMGLACGQVRLEHEGGKKVYGLNSGDAVFRQTRDSFYGGARRWVHDTLRRLQAFRDEAMAGADISALRGFVAELRDKFVRLPLHAELMGRLADACAAPGFVARQRAEAGLLDEADEMAAIEELIYGGEPLEGVLRLLVLYCAVHGGVPRRHWEPLRRDLLNAYGHHHVLTLGALQRAGLLHRREGRRSGWAAAKSAFNLLLPAGEAMDEADPQDIHYAYAGYAPLSVRLVQQALAPGGWAAAEAALAGLPGAQLDLVQSTDEAGRPEERPAPPGGALAAAAGADGGPRRRRVVLVVFIGGVTYAEVSALRFLSRKGLVDADFVVATTKVVNGSTLLRDLVAPGGQQPPRGS